MPENEDESNGVSEEEVARVSSYLTVTQKALPPNSMALVWVCTENAENYTLNFVKNFDIDFPDQQFNVLMRIAAVLLEVGSAPSSQLIEMYQKMAMQALAAMPTQGGLH